MIYKRVVLKAFGGPEQLQLEQMSGLPVPGPGQVRALLTVDGNPVLAIMDVEAVETVSDEQVNFMAEHIFRTLDPKHPGVATFASLGNTLLSGPIQVLNFSYFQTDFPDTFRTAVEIRNEIAEHGWEKVVAFQTRNPMHRAHEELCRMAMEQLNADGILIHMLLGKLKPGDIPADVRDASIRKMVEVYFPPNTVMVTGYGASLDTALLNFMEAMTDADRAKAEQYKDDIKHALQLALQAHAGAIVEITKQLRYSLGGTVPASWIAADGFKVTQRARTKDNEKMDWIGGSQDRTRKDGIDEQAQKTGIAPNFEARRLGLSINFTICWASSVHSKMWPCRCGLLGSLLRSRASVRRSCSPSSG